MFSPDKWFTNPSTGFYPHTIDQSLRFNDVTNHYLYHDISAGDRQKWTWSGWVKRGNLGTLQAIFSEGTSGSSFALYFTADDVLFAQERNSSSNRFVHKTEAVFRDVSAWYHLMLVVDTTQSSASNRAKFYVNGVQETDLETASYPSQNYDSYMNVSGIPHYLGRETGTSYLFDGIMSHVHFCDGYAYSPSDFGSTDSTTGEWKINVSPSVSYGTNGYFMFKDDNSVNDDSGNGNNFTLTAGTLTKTEDCPSNVFATLNPNDVMKQSSGILKPTYSNGNLTMANGANDNRQAFATLSPETGKWYWEMKIDTAATTGHRIGVFFGNDKTHSGSYYYGTDAFYIHQNGEIYYNGSSTTYMASYTAGDIISVAMDVTNGNIYMSKNGGANDSTWADGSGNNNQAFPGTSINGKLSASWICLRVCSEL